MAGTIRFGIGGWNFEPWRGVFYPDGLKQADELGYASRHVTSIEINSTYYSSQKPATFAKWAAAVPDDFVFAAKANRFCTNRRVLAAAGKSIDMFLNQGLVELGDRLGPIVWQFAPTKTFDPDDFAAFLDLLPDRQDGLPLSHVMEVRNDTFRTPEFVALCARRGAVICCAEHETYPMIPDVTGDLIYARLMMGSDDIPTGYPPADLDRRSARLKAYAEGGSPADLDPVDPARKAPAKPRDVFAFVIHEGKVRAPAAAMELIKRVDG